MQLTSAIRRAAQANPNAMATIYKDRQQSWSEFVTRTAKLAGALQKTGMKPGDRVAMLSLNSDRYLEYVFGVLWGGGVIVPMNLRWSPTENAYSIDDSGTEIMLVDENYAAIIPAIQEKSSTLKTLIFSGEGETPAGMLNYGDIVDAAEPVEDAGRGGEDLAGIYYTGGTTGFPKGVMLSHRSLYISNLSNCREFCMPDGVRYLHAAPMFHLADGAASFAATFAGGTHIMIPSFTPAATLKVMQDHRPTHVLLVPTMIQMLIQNPDFHKYDTTSLTTIMYGASAISEAVLVEAMTKLPTTKFVQAYGQTELSPVATILAPEYHTTEGPNAGRLRSCGKAVSTCELKVVDEDGKEVSSGTVGHIVVKGPITMLGYWNKPEQTAESFKDGWVYTGDGGYLDDDGFLYIADRLKDMIVSGGENVYSAEVEQAVTQHPAVAECVTIGIPSEIWGESVHSIVILKPDVRTAEDDIIKHCHNLIAGYKCPRSIEFRVEPMPLSAAGKVLKKDLRAPYWEGKERNVN
ncbi:long-chain-fatty-acid--CoA ligase [Sneathiella sp.]|uniref:long-chain-fatty-acid--CoA ligase n=1 Tax=Sneathiella sp. TaxID=1964365 RepID=UPI0035629E5D